MKFEDSGLPKKPKTGEIWRIKWEEEGEWYYYMIVYSARASTYTLVNLETGEIVGDFCRAISNVFGTSNIHSAAVQQEYIDCELVIRRK